MRYILAGLLAIVAGFTGLQIAEGLMGVSSALEAQGFAVLIGLMTAATYEQVARRSEEERRRRIPVRVRDRRR